MAKRTSTITITPVENGYTIRGDAGDENTGANPVRVNKVAKSEAEALDIAGDFLKSAMQPTPATTSR